VRALRQTLLIRLVQSGAHAKTAKVSPDGLCPLRLSGGALRRAVLERGAFSCLDAQPQLDAWCVASVSGQRFPMLVTCEWGRCASSQWC
jgi:hypothetical protein